VRRSVLSRSSNLPDRKPSRHAVAGLRRAAEAFTRSCANQEKIAKANIESDRCWYRTRPSFTGPSWMPHTTAHGGYNEGSKNLTVSRPISQAVAGIERPPRTPSILINGHARAERGKSEQLMREHLRETAETSWTILPACSVRLKTDKKIQQRQGDISCCQNCVRQRVSHMVRMIQIHRAIVRAMPASTLSAHRSMAYSFEPDDVFKWAGPPWALRPRRSSPRARFRCLAAARPALFRC